MSDEKSHRLFTLYEVKAEGKFHNWLKDKEVKIII